ncbi:MAG: ATP synthase F0 subunit C [Armatimonadota bacterium]
MLYLAALVIAIGFGTALAAFGCGLAQGNAVRGALEGVARQPEAGGRILTMMIIGLALIESLTIYALVLAFILLGKFPAPEVITKVIGGG